MAPPPSRLLLALTSLFAFAGSACEVDPTVIGNFGGSTGDAANAARGGSEARGEGGSTSFGGTGGASASEASGVPSCLQELFAQCPTAGACRVEDVNGDGTELRRCYENGVEEVRTRGRECGSYERRVHRADGTLCYSVKLLNFESRACETPITTWSDASGTVIATRSGYVEGAAYKLTFGCADGTDFRSCTPQGSRPCEDPLWTDAPAASCGAGTCQ